MSADLLALMTDTGYGPVTFVARGDAHEADVSGTTVLVRPDRGSLRFDASAAVDWPDGDSDSILVALEELAHTHRPDVVVIAGVPGNRLDVTVWIPDDEVTPARVAGAVMATARIAGLAVATVSDHAALMGFERQQSVIHDVPPPPPPD